MYRFRKKITTYEFNLTAITIYLNQYANLINQVAVTMGEAFFKAREVKDGHIVLIDYEGLDENKMQWGDTKYLDLGLETEDEVMLALQDFVADIMDMVASDVARSIEKEEA